MRRVKLTEVLLHLFPSVEQIKKKKKKNTHGKLAELWLQLTFTANDL